MRIVAILASFNEELFIAAAIENFIAQGAEVYLIDNDSSDRTVEIAGQYFRRGLIGIERFPRDGVFRLEPMLRRKEELAEELKADWYIHADPDEVRLPPPPYSTLAQAIAEVERAGFNAINFKNFLFLPTVQAPDHQHPRFAETMLWYRYMEPSYPNQIKAWKRQKAFTAIERIVSRASTRFIRRLKDGNPGLRTSVRLADSGGHKVEFQGLRLCPSDFVMKHYQVLSLSHAVRKYLHKHYAAEETKKGWHGWKATAKFHNLRLPLEEEMIRFSSDDELDTSEPIKRTLLYAE